MFKSRKFDNGTKMIAIAPHHLIYTYLIIHKALRYCQNWCGLLLFYPQSRQCEKPEKKGKTNIVPTPYFFIRFLGGIKKAYLIKEYDIYYCIFHFDNHVEND